MSTESMTPEGGKADLATENAVLRGLVEDLLAACDKGRPFERGAGGMTIDAQMRRTVLNGVPQWPIEEVRAKLCDLPARAALKD